MNRHELDTLATHYSLPEPAVVAMLDLSDARPTASETRSFVIRALRLAGMLSLAAGVIFFVAANWQELRVFGRFALLQSLLLISTGIALWQAPPRLWGRYALLASFILTGALLALFGQTYQTGADVYELFLTWALLGLPFAIAAQWSVAGAAWLLVLNMSLALYFGARPEGGPLSLMFSGWHLNTAQLLLIPTAVNLLLWLAARWLQQSGFASITPPWLERLLVAFTLAFATWAGSLAITGWSMQWGTAKQVDPLALLMIGALMTAIGVLTWRRREDVFPLAMIAGSVILIGVFGIAEHMGSGDMGMFFTIALWLIVSSTLCGRLLTHLVRDWRGQRVNP